MLPENVDTLIVANCILHNLLIRPSDAEQWFWEAGPTQTIEPLEDPHNRGGHKACAVQQKFMQYFVSEAGRYRK